MTSFNAADVGSYRIVGTKGQLHVDPAYECTPKAWRTTLTVNGKATRKRIGKRDQFAPRAVYLSDCILKTRKTRAVREEGLQDVRIVEAALRVGRDRQGGPDSAVRALEEADRAVSGSRDPAWRSPRCEGTERERGLSSREPTTQEVRAQHVERRSDLPCLPDAPSPSRRVTLSSVSKRMGWRS